jgi:outer membrane protein insertion porin family
VLKASLGALTQNFRFSFTDPYFLGYPFAAGIDLYSENVEIFSTYSYKILGGDLRFGKELTNNIRVDAMYKYEIVDVYDVDPFASLSVKQQAGKATTSAPAATPNTSHSAARGGRAPALHRGIERPR